MTEDEVRHLQSLLNKTGGLLVADGQSGPATRRAVADARALAGLPGPDEPDPALLAWLEARPDPSPDLPTEGVTFIAREEVGGRDYYDAHCAQPSWPGTASGITIGIGYDLRFSADIFDADWRDKLDDAGYQALLACLGRPGSASEAARLAAIRIPWEASWQVFLARSLPREVTATRGAYPGFDGLPGLCRATLVSLVYNRGAGFDDPPGEDRRKELRAIRALVSAGDLAAVPAQLLAMRRLWPSASGLAGRRAREAALWRKGLARR